MNGIEAVSIAFQKAKAEKRAVLICYYSLGYPDIASSLDVIRATAEAGADIIELGVPFSDPLADGPTIQHSTQTALEHGLTVRLALEMTRELRAAGVRQPLLLMGYYNPILAFGPAAYVAAAYAAGADGLIVPDLPPEEAGELETACRSNNMALVFLLSPASPPERIRLVAQRTSGFLYLVSLTGVTGARRNIPEGLPEFVTTARREAHTPLAIGFGISTPQQAAVIGKLADGVIVGSALIDAVRQAMAAATPPADAARTFVAGLRAGLDSIR
jgi:tryptophan synthase alpha chain